MMPVSAAPEMTSIRSKRRSVRFRRLSAAYDWMKASPQGASVVPTMPVMTISAPRVCGICGVTSPRPASAQSGCARKAAPTYVMNTAESSSSTCSMRWKLPRRTTNPTSTAAAGTERYRLIPASSRPAATPANSAQVVPRFATTSVATAAAAARVPYEERMSETSPFPVTSPSRAPSSW